MDEITITKDQFFDAVDKAQQKFDDAGSDKKDKNEMAALMMGLQNTLFSCILADVLFDKKEDK